jgi:hypothetical protein
METCPKCAKVFQHKYPSKAKEKLGAHLARKNPCDSEVYVIERKPKDDKPIHDIGALDASSVALDDYVVFTHVISRVFDIMNTSRPFACLPNIDVNHVWYVFQGGLRRAPLQAFVDVWFRVVFLPKCRPYLANTWPRWNSYFDFVEKNTGFYMMDRPTLVSWRLWKRSELYRRTCEAIRGHLSRPSRSQRIDMRLKLCEFPEGTGELVMEKIIQT